MLMRMSKDQCILLPNIEYSSGRVKYAQTLQIVSGGFLHIGTDCINANDSERGFFEEPNYSSFGIRLYLQRVRSPYFLA